MPWHRYLRLRGGSATLAPMSATDPGPEQLHHLFAFSLDMLGVSVDGRLRHVNPAWTRILGWSAQELVSRRFSSFVHPDDAEMTEAVLDALGPEKPTRSFRNRMLTAGGEQLVVNWSLRKEGHSCYLTAYDVSADADLRQRAELSEAVSKAILRTAVDPIIVIDAGGTIVDVNEGTVRLFGYEATDLLGEKIDVLMPEPYRSEHAGYIERYLAEGDPRIIGIGREVQALRADGTVFPIHLAVSEVETESDHLFTGVVTDLTERNRQRDELQAANAELEARVAERTAQLEVLLDELQRSNRDLEQFAYIASHDLQAPLRNVRQGLELLDEHLAETVGSRFDDEAQSLRDLVVAAVLRMEELIKGLLEYSRVQSRPVGEFEPLDLDDVVGDVAAMLRPDVTNVGGTLTVGPLASVTGNVVQIRQVFQNLIENAIRYRSPDRALAIEIDLDQERLDDNAVVIVVRDNGSGIDPAHHERIFDLFRRAHSGYEGVGLGLAICKRIVERHKGTLSVDSAPDEGAAFAIRLPRHQA